MTKLAVEVKLFDEKDEKYPLSLISILRHLRRSSR